MKSRLITALAIGAIAVGMLPGMAAAEGPALNEDSTGVTLYVDAGTMFWAPAAFDINADANPLDIPGVTKTSADKTVEWLSNEPDNEINVALTTLTKSADEILDGNVSIWNSTTDLVVDDFAAGTVKIADVTGNTGNTNESFGFFLKVLIPAAPAGTYVGTLTFTSDAAP